MKNALGFTLLDLLVSISILGILTGLASPSLNNFFNKQQGESAVATAYHFFKFARFSAIDKQERVYLCASNDDMSCARRGSKSLIAYVDADGDRNPSPNEFVRIEQLNYKNAFLRARMAFGRNYMFFEPSGRSSWTGSFIYCNHDSLDTSFNKVTWNRIGRIYKGVDLNHDGQIDDRLDPAQACS